MTTCEGPLGLPAPCVLHKYWLPGDREEKAGAALSPRPSPAVGFLCPPASIAHFPQIRVCGFPTHRQCTHRGKWTWCSWSRLMCPLQKGLPRGGGLFVFIVGKLVGVMDVP